jgi:hypothetical protein
VHLNGRAVQEGLGNIRFHLLEGLGGEVHFVPDMRQSSKVETPYRKILGGA